MLASRDKNAVRAEIEQTAPKTLQPREIIHDPFILEFLGIRQGEHFLEGDLEQMLISKLQHFLLELGRRYSVAAKYMTYLPTQEEIRQLLCSDLPDNL